VPIESDEDVVIKTTNYVNGQIDTTINLIHLGQIDKTINLIHLGQIYKTINLIHLGQIYKTIKPNPFREVIVA
jgi:hypothetical protein